MNLSEHYNHLWNQSLQKFRRGAFEFDPLLDSESDTRYGMTLLGRPSEEVAQNILNVLEEIHSVAPHQYYYPRSDLHLTVLSIISCHAGFSLDDIDCPKYQRLVRSAVDGLSPLRIHFKGITASPSCIMVQGFPEGSQLTTLRNRLRKGFKQSGLQHSIDQRYQRQTAHMTVIRFKEPLLDAENFVATVAGLRDRQFGSCEIDYLELVGNDWYQQQDKVQRIEKFTLNKST